MLKRTMRRRTPCCLTAQPPSGGCVLKLWLLFKIVCYYLPAAFGRLRVETYYTAIYSPFQRNPSRLRAAAC